MADTPLIPNEVDVKHLTDYLNLQKQLSDTFKTNLDIMDKLQSIDKNLEKELQHKVQTQREYLGNIDKENMAYQKQLEINKTLDSANRAAALHVLESIKDRIRYNSDMVSSLQQQIQYQIQSAELRYAEEHKYQLLIASMFSKTTGFQSKHLQNYKDIYQQLSKSTFGLGKYAGILSGVLVILMHTLDTFKKFDESAANFRISMGLTRSEAKNLRSEAERLAIDFMHVGVTIDGAYASIKALGKEMGSVHIITTDIVKMTALMKSQLGVAEEDSAGFLRNMAAVSKSTMQSQQSMAYMAADMAQAAGVPLAQVMNDIATKSSVTLTMISRIPTQVMRAAIELRKMGTSLNEAAKSSREILNFTDNINAEMEASVLLGKSINLQHARELAYRRDLEGSTKEILKITKNIDFENLDVFQQEAFARATGKSVDELLRMVQAERQWEAARRDPMLTSKVQAYEKLHKSVEAEAKSRAKNLQLMIEQRSNQDRMTSISNKWNQLMTQAGAILLPVIDLFLSAVIPVMDIAQGVFAWMVALKGVFSVVATLGNRFVFFEKIFYGIVGLGIKLGSVFSRFFGIFSKIGQYLTPVFKFLGLFGGTFGKAIPVLGEIIMALQFIWNFGKRIIAIWNDPNMNLGQKILAGLKAVVGALYDTLIQPFVDAWKWITSFWGGHSPSQLGLTIVQGLVSVGGMIFDALTAPFRNGIAWIMDKIPGMGKVAGKLRGGIGGTGDSSIESKAAATYIPAVQVTPTGTKVAGTTDIKSPEVTSTKASDSNSDKLLNDILTAINTLNSNLEAGRIGIHMDGQLLSATLARQTSFRGGYGVNTI